MVNWSEAPRPRAKVLLVAATFLLRRNLDGAYEPTFSSDTWRALVEKFPEHTPVVMVPIKLDLGWARVADEWGGVDVRGEDAPALVEVWDDPHKWDFLINELNALSVRFLIIDHTAVLETSKRLREALALMGVRLKTGTERQATYTNIERFVVEGDVVRVGGDDHKLYGIPAPKELSAKESSAQRQDRSKWNW